MPCRFAHISGGHETGKPGSRGSRPTKVLIADDDESILESLAMLLGRYGHETVGVHDATDIAQVARRERPDVILQDVGMPGLDVRRHIQAMRSDPATAALPVILFTGSVDAWDIWRDIGADGVLEKPFEPAVLRRVLATVKPHATS